MNFAMASLSVPAAHCKSVRVSRVMEKTKPRAQALRIEFQLLCVKFIGIMTRRAERHEKKKISKKHYLLKLSQVSSTL